MIAMRELAIPHAKLNVNGGACALGHPIGASGARILIDAAGSAEASRRQARRRRHLHRRRRSDRDGRGTDLTESKFERATAMNPKGVAAIVTGGGSGLGRGERREAGERRCEGHDLRHERRDRARARGEDRRSVLQGERHRSGQRQRSDRGCREQTWRCAHARELRRHRHRRQDGRQGIRAASARSVSQDDRGQSDRHVQRDLAVCSAPGAGRTARRRTRRHHQHGQRRGLRRSDRAGCIFRVEGRCRRHDAADRARSRAAGHSRRDDRTGHFPDADDGDAAAERAGIAGQAGAVPEPSRQARRVRAAGAQHRRPTRCSTAKPSASTAPFGCRHDERNGSLQNAATRCHAPEDTLHRTGRHRLSDRSGRHDVGGPRRTRGRGIECRRPRHPHGAHAADAGRSAPRDRALPRDDGQAVRREPDDPAVDEPAALCRVSQGDHRQRHQDRRDRRPQSAGACRALQGARHHGRSQMHRRAPRAVGRAHGRRCDLDRRLRMRRPSGRRRHSGPDPDSGRRRQGENSDDRLRRLRRRPRPGRSAGAGRRRHQHGHALLRDRRSADPSARRSN